MHIFISYRRTDSDIAGRIADRLLGEFGSDGVFLDVDNIPIGRDFRVVIDQAMSRSDCLVMVIGPGWISASERNEGAAGNLRSEADFVRLEVQSALQSEIPIIPVLVGDVQMPAPNSLPEDISKVAYINGTAVRSGRDFQTDIEHLITALRSISAHASTDARTPVETVNTPRNSAVLAESAPSAVLSGNVPEPAFKLLGRELEFQQLHRYLTQEKARLITILGFGGAGKTRLAIELRTLAGHFPDGVWMVSLASVSGGSSLAGEIAELFSVGADSLQSYLADKRLLLIVDNCEHVLSEATELVDTLLMSVGVSVVATSREFLGIHGEKILRLGALSIPESTAPFSELSTNASVELFIQHARSAHSDFELTTENAPALIQIVTIVAGIPLALELAASRLRVLSVSEISERLSKSFKLLKSGARDSMSRHRTLEQAIDWSYQMLNDDEQMIFRKLSVFRGGFTLEAATAVDGADDDLEVLDLIGQLVDKSLLQRRSNAGQTRYGCLEPLRQFAMARANVEELEQATAAHALFFAAHVERVAVLLRGPEQVQWLAALRADNGNIDAALAHTCEAKLPDIARSLASTLTWFWLAERKLSQARDWLEAAIALDGGEPVPKAYALISLGFLKGVDDPSAPDLFEYLNEGISLFEDAGFGPGVGQARLYEGIGFFGVRDFASAEAIFTQLRPAMRDAQFAWGEAMCEWWLGICTTYSGKYDIAREHYQGALEAFESIGDIFLIAWNRLTMGRLELLLGDLKGARCHFEAAMPLMVQVQDRIGVGVLQLSFAAIDQESGNIERAKQCAADAQREIQLSQGGQGIGWAMSNAPVETTTALQSRAAIERYRLALETPVDNWIEIVLADAATFVGASGRIRG